MLSRHEELIYGCRYFVRCCPPRLSDCCLSVCTFQRQGVIGHWLKGSCCLCVRDFRDHVQGVLNGNLLHVLLVTELFTRKEHRHDRRRRRRKMNGEYHFYFLSSFLPLLIR